MTVKVTGRAILRLTPREWRDGGAPPTVIPAKAGIQGAGAAAWVQDGVAPAARGVVPY